MIDVSYRVIADHIRCLTFALTDGAMPSNEGRGYVLRRILRRAVRYGRQYLDMHEPFLCDLVEPVADHMVAAFPELENSHGGKNIQHVAEIIRDEEASFLKTLDRGIKIFVGAAGFALWDQIVSENSDLYAQGSNDAMYLDASYAKHVAVGEPDPDVMHPETNIRIRRGTDSRLDRFKLADLTADRVRRFCHGAPVISGRAAFNLHDTHGFPIDLTELMARELGMGVDIGEYERLMEEAREKARGSKSLNLEGTLGTIPDVVKGLLGETDDSAKYSTLELPATVGLLHQHEKDNPEPGDAQGFSTGTRGGVLLDRTCFYAEQGGQVGDAGVIETETGKFSVESTARFRDGVMHLGIMLDGALRQGQSASLVVDSRHRIPTQKNHTATHLLNWALREVLCAADEPGRPHVQQKGSLVDPEKTRFDFSHSKPMGDAEIDRVEALVNERIEAGLTVDTNGDESVDQAAARKINTLRAVFGEKYPDKVRVVSIGPSVQEMLADPENEKWMAYSVEFCGGTHVKNTSEIERFVITTEEGVAKGIRRLVGVTGETAKQAVAAGEGLLAEVRALAGDGPHSGPYTEPNPDRKGEADGQASDQYRDRKGMAAGRASDQYRDRKGVASGSGGVEEPLPYGRGSVGGGPDVDLPAKLAAFQKKLADAVIPVVVRHQIVARLADLQKEAKKIEKQQAVASGHAVRGRVAELLAAATTIGDVTVVVGDVPSAGADALRSAIDWVRNKTTASAILLATENNGKVILIAGMSKDVVAQGVKAGDLIKELAPLVGGRGGGRPDMAQGGGSDASGIPVAVERASAWIGERLA